MADAWMDMEDLMEDLIDSRQTLAARQLYEICQMGGIRIVDIIESMIDEAVSNGNLNNVRWICDTFDSPQIYNATVVSATKACEMDMVIYLTKHYRIKIIDYEDAYIDAVSASDIPTDKRIRMLEWLLSQGCMLNSSYVITDVVIVCEIPQIVQWFVDRFTVSRRDLRYCVVHLCQQQDNIEALKCFVPKYRMSTADLLEAISESCIAGHINSAEYLYTSCGFAVGDLDRVRENIEQSSIDHKLLALEWIMQKLIAARADS